jgi:TrmH family RNA methyltransferase
MITSTSNRRVKWVRSLQNDKSQRWEERKFVLEGKRLAEEWIRTGMHAELVLHTDHLDEHGRGLVNCLTRLGAEAVPVSEAVMEACSDTESPPGILIVVPFPEPLVLDPMTLVLVGDRLADPGNLGTMLRTASAAGVEAVFLTQGSVDPYNPKVVRAGMGAQLHLPIESLTTTAIVERLADMDLWLADRDGEVSYDGVDWRRPAALIIGNEAHGASDEMRSFIHGCVSIPMRPEVESLNAAVATAVILFEVQRQREGR